MVLIGAAYHRALMHSRMTADDILDHGREHLEAVVTDDHALDAGVQIHKAVLVHVADIAGVCPNLAVCMAAQDHVGLLGLIVVALHDGGGADADLAALTDGQFGLGARLKNGHHRVQHGNAHAAGLGHVAGGNGSGRGDLGHAVALGQRILHVVCLQELVHGQLSAQRQRVAASGIVADEGEILLLLEQRRSCHLLVVSRNAEHVLGLVLPDQCTQLVGVQIGDDDDMQAHDQRHMHAAGIAVGNERRHNVHQLLAAAEQVALGDEFVGQRVEAVVGQHNALGRTGGTAGVHHHAGVLRVVGFGVHALILALCNKVLPVDHVGLVAVLVRVGQLVANGQMQRQGVCGADDQHALHIGALFCLVAALIGHIQANQQAGIHLLDVLVDALNAVARVHQIQRCADHIDSVEGVDHLGGHHTDNGDDVALLHAESTEGSSGFLDIHKEVCKGEFAAIILQSGLAQVVLVLMAEILKSAALGQRHVDVFLVIVLQPGLRSGRIERFTLFSSHRIKSSFLSSFHC